MGLYDGRDRDALLNDVEQRIKQLNNLNPRDREVAIRLATIHRNYPSIQMGVKLALAEALADDNIVADIAQKSAFAGYAQANKQAQVKPKWWQKAIGKTLEVTPFGSVMGGAQVGANAAMKIREVSQKDGDRRDPSFWESVLSETIGALENVSEVGGKFTALGAGEVGRNIPVTGDIWDGFRRATAAIGGAVDDQFQLQSKIKTASRWFDAVGRYPWEYHSTALAEVFEGPFDIADMSQDLYNLYGKAYADPQGWFKENQATINTTSLANIVKYGDQAGQGYFLGGVAEEKRVEQVRRQRWQFANGQSWTPGGGAASLIFEPGSAPFRFLSGVIDAAGSWISDPTNLPLDEVAKSVKAGKEIPGIGTAMEQLAADALASGTGLTDDMVKAVDESKFFQWLDSRRGRRLVAKTAAETNELKILEGYGGKLTPEQARRLANETDPDKIRGIIAEQAIRLNSETNPVAPGFVPFATSAGQLPFAGALNTLSTNAEVIPGYKMLKNSAWFTKMPDRSLALVNGTPTEKSEAIRNMANWLRTLRLDPYEGEGKKLMTAMFDWAGADGTKVDANKVRNLVMGGKDNPGIMALAMRRNGWSEEAVDSTLKNFREQFEAFRNWAVDDAGRIADGGLAQFLLGEADQKELRGVLNQLFPGKFGKKATKDEMMEFVRGLEKGLLNVYGPLALTQMANSMVVLPDPRQMRGLTNPFWRKLNRTISGTELENYLRIDKAAKALAPVEWFQNEVWRPYALMSVGYMVRNTMDARLRMAMTGLGRSPWDLLAMSTDADFMGRLNYKTNGFGTIMGTDWVDAGQEGLPEFDEAAQIYTNIAQSKTIHEIDDPTDEIVRAHRTTGMVPVDIGTVNYPQGLRDEAVLHHTDPIRRISAQLSHLPDDEQAKTVKAYLDSGTPAAKRDRQALIDYFASGVEIANRRSGVSRATLPIPEARNWTTDQIVDAWFRNSQHKIVSSFTRNNDQLRVLVGYADVPLGPGETLAFDDVSPLTGGRVPDAGELTVIERKLDDGTVDVEMFRVLERYVPQTPEGDDILTEARFKVVPVAHEFDRAGNVIKADAFAGDVIKPQLKQAIDRMRQVNANIPRRQRILPDKVLHRERRRGKIMTTAGNVMEQADTAIKYLPSKFFEVPVKSWMAFAEKHPAFRQLYYRYVALNTEFLTKMQAQQLLDDIETFAKNHAKLADRFAADPERAMGDYVGGRENLDRIREAAKKAIETDAGTGTIEDLNTYAATMARVEIEDLFFNNMSRSNFTDAFRILAPFGAAWAEVFGTYTKAVIENPARLRRAQLVYRGAEGADLEGDSRGIVFRDPMSGQMMLNIPLYGMLTQFLTSPGFKMFQDVMPTKLGGAIDLKNVPVVNQLPLLRDYGPQLDIDSVFPVRQLNAGFSFNPQLGPMAQIALGKVLDDWDVPNEETVRRVLNPYGMNNFEQLAPGWINKVFQAMKPNNKLFNSSQAGLERINVFLYLASTGEYDLADPNERTRAWEDSARGASTVMLMRAVSQALGPTAMRPRYKIEVGTELGEKMFGPIAYVGEAQKLLSDLQKEDYESAPLKFIAVLGINAIPYLAPRSQAVEPYKGLETTREFESWRRENRGLVEAFKDVAPYFGPSGDKGLAPEAFSAQIGEGLRQRLSGYTIIDKAQYIIGSAFYRYIKKEMIQQKINRGEKSTLTDSEEDYLRTRRREINKKYPGFPVVPLFDPGEFPRFVNRLEQILQDRRLEGNPVAAATREYLAERQKQINELEGLGTTLRSKRPIAAEKRGILFQLGEQLAQQYPDFDRIWSQELSQEVDLGDTGR